MAFANGLIGHEVKVDDPIKGTYEGIVCDKYRTASLRDSPNHDMYLVVVTHGRHHGKQIPKNTIMSVSPNNITSII
jgi:hypothetical protein